MESTRGRSDALFQIWIVRFVRRDHQPLSPAGQGGQHDYGQEADIDDGEGEEHPQSLDGA